MDMDMGGTPALIEKQQGTRVSEEQASPNVAMRAQVLVSILQHLRHHHGSHGSHEELLCWVEGGPRYRCTGHISTSSAVMVVPPMLVLVLVLVVSVPTTILAPTPAAASATAAACGMVGARVVIATLAVGGSSIA